MKRKYIIDGESLTLPIAKEISLGADISIPKKVKTRLHASRGLVDRLVKEEKPVYGVNTGFGFLANKKIPASQLKQLQKNLVMSHSAGYGPSLEIPEIRLAMVLRLNVLVKGYTGVRYELCQSLLDLIQAGIYPFVPAYGSVGASGDLIPLAHLALPIIGLGRVYYKGQMITANLALKKAGLKPLELSEKEGLSLINGTQIMLSVGGIALSEAIRLLNFADLAAALSYEALCANIGPLHPFIHAIRRQIGQIESAAKIRACLEGSYLFDEDVERRRVQDPYSLRCAPQVHGASRDTVAYSAGIAERELNAVTDNPLVFLEEERIISGGNFHGQYLAISFDAACMAISELANISDRRLELLLNPYSSGLPAFLVKNEGLDSGYMCLQYLSSSLVNENKLLSNPSCTDSIPGNVGIEDHVSMGMTSARKLRKCVNNVKACLACEILAAAQAIDLRSIKKLGRETKKLYKAIRSRVPFLKNDRILADEIEQTVQLVDQYEY